MNINTINAKTDVGCGSRCRSPAVNKLHSALTEFTFKLKESDKQIKK